VTYVGESKGGPIDVLNALSEVHIWIVGDVMLDEYLLGTTDRVSPEAPVPVMRVRGSEYRPGGAANVARQVATLGAGATLVGTIGADSAGERLRHICKDAGIGIRTLVTDAQRPTTRKMRVLSQSQQLLRLDWEETNECASEVTQHLLKALVAEPPPDAIILSDYSKGVLTREMIAGVFRARGDRPAPVIVDPKRKDLRHYLGASIIMPNLREFESAAGRAFDPDDRSSMATVAQEMANRLGAEAIIVTMGGRGMLVAPARGTDTAIPAMRRAVYDVTGAGDIATAVLSVAIAAKASLVAAAEIANAAAGISVGHVGTVAVDCPSLKSALSGALVSKIVTRAELASRADEWRMSGKRIVFANGCFDLLHAGHLALLRGAAAFGDIVVIAVNSDSSVRRLKGDGRPVVGQSERAALLAALTYVDAVTVFDEDTPLDIIREVRPHTLVKGADYRNKEVVGGDLVRRLGGRVALIPLVPEKSTSAVVAGIRGNSH